MCALGNVSPDIHASYHLERVWWGHMCGMVKWVLIMEEMKGEQVMKELRAMHGVRSRVHSILWGEVARRRRRWTLRRSHNAPLLNDTHSLWLYNTTAKPRVEWSSEETGSSKDIHSFYSTNIYWAGPHARSCPRQWSRRRGTKQQRKAPCCCHGTHVLRIPQQVQSGHRGRHPVWALEEPW